MNNQHPVINDELIRKWLGEHFSRFTSNSTWLAPLAKSTATGEVSDSERYLATQAADWQLEQVNEWLRENLQDHRYSGINIVVDRVIEELTKTMRPATTTQDNS
ncbi:MAG: hypothetical protein P8Y72_01465 [Anaerolineales bacterium]